MSTEKITLETDFDSDAMERLYSLMERTGASSREEVISNALRLYEWFQKEIREGEARLLLVREKAGEKMEECKEVEFVF